MTVIEKMQGKSEKNDSWMFRSQSEVVEFFRIFSKYTPARPDIKQARETEKRPMERFIF